MAGLLVVLLLSLFVPAQAASLTRTSSFEYYPNGQLKTETVEPDKPDLCLQTTHAYDQWGNRTSTSASACAGASATTLSSANAPRTRTDIYRSDGRFVETSTNALGHSETKTYDDRFGAVQTLTGPNGLSTLWEYDSFGRKKLETRADGTKTTWQYQLCTEATANCPATVGLHTIVWVLIEQSYNANGSPSAPYKRQYFDTLERVVRTQTLGFDGGGPAPTIVQDSEYNKLGQLTGQSAPYVLGTGLQAQVWSRYYYDELGRAIKEERPDPSATGGIATSRTTYQGLSTTVINALGQTKTSVKNSQGQVVQITDTQGSIITYAYDPVGNLTQTNAAGSITTLRYDEAGRRKTSMEDPAMGRWKYDYNAFGELVKQTDSLGKVTTIAYDQLGRMTQRVEGELTSWWSFETNFDATNCGKAVGKLCQAKTDNGYLRSHYYDDKGRMDYTATLLDNSQAVVRSQYDDNTGRVKNKTWVNTGYQVNYGYTPLGYLWSVSASGAGVPKPVSYEIQQMNAAGQILRYKTGNQVIVVNGVDERTQRLMSISAAVEGQGPGSILSHSYSYDAIGNLLTRADNSPGVATSEAFGYDSLNRIKSATLIGGAVSPPQTVEVLYDARGNITYKSDVGRYWYDGARPNRMTQVTLEMAPGANVPLSGTRALSYAFDDYRPGAANINGTTVGNGNLEYTVTHDSATNRHFVRAESYTSFNMPAQITYSNFSADTSTCPQGYTLSNGSCTQTVVSSVPAMAVEASYVCPAGSTCTPPPTSYRCATGTLSGNQCIITQTLQTPPGSSNTADRTLSFVYGPEHQRVKQNVTLTGNGTSAYFAGNTWYANGEDSLGLSYEKEVRANGTTEHKHYVAAAGFVFAIVTTREGNLNGLAASTTSYLIKDHLGSIAAITNEAGTVTERLAYDPWGKRRYINSLPGQSDKLDALVGQNTDRGYTEHEHLDEIGVIHMNGRIYDPLMGRFMSADPFIADPYSLAVFNRYSYVYNNPLNQTDPTGFFSWSVGGPNDSKTAGTTYTYNGVAQGCSNCTIGGWGTPGSSSSSRNAYDSSKGSYSPVGGSGITPVPLPSSHPHAPKADTTYLHRTAAVLHGYSVGVFVYVVGQGWLYQPGMEQDFGSVVYSDGTLAQDFQNGFNLAGGVGDYLPGQKRVTSTLRNVAPTRKVDDAAKAGTEGASGVLETSSGGKYLGNSTGSSASGGTARAPMHSKTQEALEVVKNPSRSHGACCEIDAINKALNAGDSVQGAKMGPVQKNNSGRVLPACSTCREVKKTLGIE